MLDEALQHCRYRSRVITIAHNSRSVPVKDVVVSETQSVKEVSEKLPQISVVWLVFKLQWPAEIQVSSKFAYREKEKHKKVKCIYSTMMTGIVV